MNWDAFGAIGEVVGAGAVIFTLFFVGVQIRSAKLFNRNHAFSQIFDGVSRHSIDVSTPDLSEATMRGLLDFDSLHGADRFQFDSIMCGFLNYIEATLSTAEDRMFEERVFDEWGYYVRLRFAPYSGFRDWWAIAHPTWPEHVVRFIDECIGKCNQEDDFYRIKGH